jgi:hypothetical protein
MHAEDGIPWPGYAAKPAGVSERTPSESARSTVT